MRARLLLPLALIPLLAACGAQPAPSPAQAQGPASMHREQIGADYLLVPEGADKGKTPKLQVAGTTYGVAVALPPGYGHAPAANAPAPSGPWTIFLAHPSAGGQNLLAAATRVAVLPKRDTNLTILGVTGPYALFAADTPSGRTLDLVAVAGAHAGAVKALGPVASGPGAALAIRGMVFFLGPHGKAHMLRVATGAVQTGGPATAPLAWQQGRLFGDGQAVAMPGLSTPPVPALPQGFQWIAIGSGAQASPIAAVPSGYTVAQIQGGSSHGVSAKDPHDAAVQVTIFENACAGCYNPGFMAKGVNTLSTPIYVGSQAGTTPLGDHGFISTAQGKGGTEVFQLVADYLGGGDLEAAVTVPRADAALAKEILRTVRLPW